MSATIISGKIAREALAVELIKKVRALSVQPKLAIIQIGDREDSTSYIRAKKNFAIARFFLESAMLFQKPLDFSAGKIGV